MTSRKKLLLALSGAVVLQSMTATAELTDVDANGATLLPMLLLWNASASVPPGLYLLRPAAPLRVGELVVASPPKPLAQYIAMRGYLPSHVPLLKHIAALSGQIVCRNAGTVKVDGVAVALALGRDHLNRSLPVWQGCRQLHSGDVFLLNEHVPDSFDGRYFSVLSTSSIVARAAPLWTQKEQH